ncbi:Protein NO VEIN [Linum grandiflorum]
MHAVVRLVPQEEQLNSFLHAFTLLPSSDSFPELIRMASTPRQHIEELRRTRFSIGEKENPLASMLDQAVKYLSAELYAKDVHFLMELIQNAEDNEYSDGVDPSLEFVITSRDITGTGAPATLLVFNNEKGFSARNIESICSVGKSTKKGNRKRGYIGEKGIGFKSVFLITSRPYIFSNGYQIRFNEKPCPDCKLGYVVPEWVDDHDKPSLSDIQKIYWSSGSPLPTTTLVLPLKPDKVKPVKEQLSSVHPEILLFLSKIKHLSVRENNQDHTKLNTVSEVAITKEVNFVTRKNMDAESYTLHLSAGGQFSSYYLWKQRFPVKREYRVESRIEVEEWQVTLAFPNGERLHNNHKGTHSSSPPGIYAFLPTEMVTNFPFIIQGDFILSSSREALLLDNIWNQGIMECVPSAFVNALISLVKTVENAPVSSLIPMFRFLPVNASSYPLLNTARESIRLKLTNESIVPSESCKEQKFFHKPSEVCRLVPDFWNILNKARMERINLDNLSSHGCYVLNSSFDHTVYDDVLSFLGVGFVEDEWYTRCIPSSTLLKLISNDLYVELLHFIAENWSTNLKNAKMEFVPLLRHVGADGNVSICSINESKNKSSGKVLCRCNDSSYASLLINWNKEFWNVSQYFFIPESIQAALRSFAKRDNVVNWLTSYAGLAKLDVHQYSKSLCKCLGTNREFAVAYAHFLHRSYTADFLVSNEVGPLCLEMPLVDRYGTVIRSRKQVLVPGGGSKWLELIGTNPWRGEGFVELGEDYSQAKRFCGETSGGKPFMDFLKAHVQASDIPYLSPPDAEIPTVSGPLTKKNAFLLLDWIQNLVSSRRTIPERFLTCISKGSWLKVTTNGSSGYKPPSKSFMLSPRKHSSKWGSILQDGTVLADIPLVDISFYGESILSYESSLKAIGVMTEYDEACNYIGNHLMSQVDSAISTRSTVFQILKFIRFLRESGLCPDSFILSIKEGKWLLTTTSSSCCSPDECVLRNGKWEIAQQISAVNFIDDSYYGQEIHSFDKELRLLGVTVDFAGSGNLIVQHLKPSSCLSGLTKEALFLILQCVRQSSYATKVVTAVQNAKCLKTDSGYSYPAESFLYDSEWGCLLDVFQSSSVIKNDYYGVAEIMSYKQELKKLGVKVEFEDATKAFLQTFKQQVSKFTKQNVLSFLACYRQLKNLSKPLSDIKKCIRSEKWLRTRLGDYRSPADCILFGPDWEYLRAVTCLPFLDDTDNGYGMVIHQYAAELKLMGVVSTSQDGAKFVFSCLHFPDDASTISSKTVLSLLDCVRILLEQKDYCFPESLTDKVSGQWLKTCFGYRSPKDCCLFDPTWETDLKVTDGPFIDVSFYGPQISSCRKELGKLGVCVDPAEVCKLLSNDIDRHSELATIIRIYDFLRVNKWKAAEKESTSKIWFSGKWVDSGECVIRDRDDLFGSQLYVLEKHYSSKLLDFFQEAFDVRYSPSLTQYCELWEKWESDTRHSLSSSECSAFWKFVVRNKSISNEEILAGKLLKLPTILPSGEIVMSDKRGVFIADDLLLKELFSEYPIFVWYMPDLSRTKLLDVYKGIGVRRISESVEKEENSANQQVFEQVNPDKVFIGKQLGKIILGFLADPSLEMEASQRQAKLRSLLNLTFYQTPDPLTVTCSLKLSSTGEVVRVEATELIRWDRGDSKMYVQKLKCDLQRGVIEYACRFAEVIAKGVLWEKEDRFITALSGIIRLGFLVKFDEAAVDFLMKANNLQIFVEDEEFLSSAFPST